MRLKKLFWRVIAEYDKMRKASWTIVEKGHLLISGIKFGRNLHIRGHLYIYNRGMVEIGDDVTINSSVWSNPIGGAEHTCLQVFPEGCIKIGNKVGISNSAFTCRESIIIEDNVLFGAGCKVYDTDFHPLEYIYRYGKEKDNSYIRSKAIRIEKGAFIGGGSYILKGTHIGKNAIIGAGSVVSGIIPEGEIWAGNPAQFIKKAPGY